MSPPLIFNLLASHDLADPGTCFRAGKAIPWSSTAAAKKQLVVHPDINNHSFCTPEGVYAGNGDLCKAGNWVIYEDHLDANSGRQLRLGRVLEVLQRIGSASHSKDRADAVLIDRAIAGDSHDYYHMPRVQLLDESMLVEPLVRRLLIAYYCLSINRILRQLSAL